MLELNMGRGCRVINYTICSVAAIMSSYAMHRSFPQSTQLPLQKKRERREKDIEREGERERERKGEEEVGERILFGYYDNTSK
jgi:hypothetical protein